MKYDFITKNLLHKSTTLQKKTMQKLASGFMTIEVLIAIAIITMSILAAMSVAEKSISLSRQAVHYTQANFLLEEGAEATRIVRDNAWSGISALTPGTDYYPTFSDGTWTLSSTPNTVGIFTRKVTIAAVNRDNITKDIAVSGTNDAGTKLMTVTISWPEGGNTITKTLAFYISNIFE